MFRALRRRLAPAPPIIGDGDWEALLRDFAPGRALPGAERAALRDLCERFLASKSFTGVAGLDLTSAMRLHIAAQACLPVLHLGLRWYEGWSGIVVYPDRFRVHRRVHGADGTVQESIDELSGEAWDGGPVVLSWADAAGQEEPGSHGGNVVIHEFAHKIDLLGGEADGVPPFDRRLHAGLSRDRWLAALEDSLERLREGVEIAEQSIPRHVDPESAAADAYYALLPLDPYAATDEAEFFAVSSESFFTDGARLRDAFPEWHRLLSSFYLPRS